MSTKIHRIRYYNPKPQGINCVSFNKSSKQVAVARGDASIEIWDIGYAPYLVKYIPGVENGSVEALGWVNERLLSTGLGGALVEWDLETLSVKTTTLLTGHAAWCLDVNSSNTLVAVGTEQGYVNVYSVENDEIVYKKIFDKQEGRILCCRFDKTGNILVTGSLNSIRVWNVDTGHALTRISASRGGREIIVWSVAVLSDNTIVSGDSRGRLTFWDGTAGDQIESYTTHKSDILAVAVSEDEKSIYCSGLDPLILHFSKVNQSSNKQTNAQWVKSVQRHIHEHDVRDLVFFENKLMSVGADGYLTLSGYPPKWVMRIPPMIPAPRSSVSPKKKLILLRYNNYLEVWKLGSCATNKSGNTIIENINNKPNPEINDKWLEQESAVGLMNGSNNNYNRQCPTSRSILKIKDNPLKLVSIQAKGQKQIKCCEISPNGELIVYSTDSHVRILKLETDEDTSNTSVSKVILNGLSTSCDHITFSEDSAIMVGHSAGSLHIIQVDPDAGATIVQSISTEKYFKSKSVLHLVLSKKTSLQKYYLIVADTQGAIAIWTKGPKKFEHYVTLPKYKCLPSAITVDCKQDALLVVYVDQKIVEYSLKEKKFTEWPGIALPPQWHQRNKVVNSVTVHPKRKAVIFQDSTSLWVLEKQSQSKSDEPEAKKRPQKHANKLSVKIIPIKYVAGFHWLTNDEAVTLEILPENILQQLPQSLPTKRFGCG